MERNLYDNVYEKKGDKVQKLDSVYIIALRRVLPLDTFLFVWLVFNTLFIVMGKLCVCADR